MDFLKDIIILFQLCYLQLKIILPYWIIGIVAGSFVSVFASDKISAAVTRINGKKSGVMAVIPAALLGAVSPICMYGTVPLIAALGKKGVPEYLLASFMITSILINPNLFIFSFTLGAPIALARLFSCILSGITAGLLVKLCFRKTKIFDFNSFMDKKKKRTGSNILIILFNDMYRAIKKTGPYFLVGIILTALFTLYFPKELFLTIFSSNKGFGILMAASLGVPVYVCGGGTIPLIRAWMNVGMSAGSAIAFMLSGPATKITNLSAVKIILGKKNFVVYLIFNIIFAVLIGIIVDIFYMVLY